MKNAEKYAHQIAEILSIAESCIVAPVGADGWPVCTKCIFEGICTDEKNLEEWLLHEAT